MLNIFDNIDNSDKTGFAIPINTVPRTQLKEVRQTGGNYVLSVYIQILKTGQNSVIVACDKFSIPYATAFTNALKQILNELNNDYPEGFMVNLTEGLVHPTDFIRLKTEAFFYSYLKTVLNS